MFLKPITKLLQIRKIISSNQSTNPLPQTNSEIENPIDSNEDKTLEFIDLECNIINETSKKRDKNPYITIESQGQLSEISENNIKNIFTLENDDKRCHEYLYKLNSQDYSFYSYSNNKRGIKIKPEIIRKYFVDKGVWRKLILVVYEPEDKIGSPLYALSKDSYYFSYDEISTNIRHHNFKLYKHTIDLISPSSKLGAEHSVEYLKKKI